MEPPQSEADGLEDLAFLARSRHRLAVLLALSPEGIARRELHETLGISQPTLGRILNAFEARGWLANGHDGTYRLTPLGDVLQERVGAVIDAATLGRDLGSLADRLPWTAFDFGPGALAEATITRPTDGNPLGHMARFDGLATAADHAVVLSNVVSCTPAADAAASDREFLADLDELIVTRGAIEADLTDGELRDWIADAVAADELLVRVIDGTPEVLLGRFDDAAAMVPIDESGLPVGLVDTTEPAVVDWVDRRLDGFRAGATTLAPEEPPFAGT